MKNKITIALYLLALFSGPAHAQSSATNTTKATASLSSSCTFTVSDVNFGDLTPVGSPALQWVIGSIVATCSRGVSFNVQMGEGKYYDGTYRNMNGTSSSTKLKYTICKTQKTNGNTWGSSSMCVDPWRTTLAQLTATGTGTTQIISMYALTSTGFYTPDSYTDTNTVTLVY